MPSSVAIGMLVLASILLLVALLGGNFKLFGAEISEKVSNKGIRWTAGILGVGLLQGPLQALQSKSDLPNSSCPSVSASHTAAVSEQAALLGSPQTLTASPAFFIGRWRVDQAIGDVSGGTEVDYQEDGTWSGTETSFVGGVGQRTRVGGRWRVDEMSGNTFRLSLVYDPRINRPPWQGHFRVLDQDRVQNIDQNYVAERVH